MFQRKHGNTERKHSTPVCEAHTTVYNARRTLATRSAAPLVAFKHVCMPTAATFSTSFDSIIHPMDQGKSTFNYMSIGWLFRKIFRKHRGLWRVRHPVYFQSRIMEVYAT